MDSSSKGGVASNEQPAKNKKSRISRFDLRTNQTILKKTVKPREKASHSTKPLLVVRRIIDHRGHHTGTIVDIKSSSIVEALLDLNESVEGTSLRKTPPTAKPELFFFSREGLEARWQIEKDKDEPDEAMVADLKVAIDFVHEEFDAKAKDCDTLFSIGEVSYDVIWALFKPNSLVNRYHQYSNQQQVLMLKSVSKRQGTLGQPEHWSLDCDIVVDDGLSFGLAKEPIPLRIETFEGTRKIRDLPVYPFERHPDFVTLREQILRRGKLYTSLNMPFFGQGVGNAMTEYESSERPVLSTFRVFGRSILDANGFRAFNPDISYIPKVHRRLSREDLTEEQLLIVSPVALGFNFGSKRWGALPISEINRIDWNDSAFESLVLEDKPKTLIHSLIKQHQPKSENFDDVIVGKGKGLIFLFSGPPGTGKTLTAEAMAEITRRPLYSVSAGELGTEPEVLDRNLSRVLELSKMWDAILLLDEADVFLQERESADVYRNALVSIFLRQLEYFSGILILTTNRVQQCDVAFESRVHLSVRYPELGSNARAKIWRSFLHRVEAANDNVSVSIDENDVLYLAESEVNGRQIKNIISSARAIAKEKLEPLSLSHIELVLEVLRSSRESSPFSYKPPARKLTGLSDLLG
ncbi:hypothetical protein G7054_g7709 [Neopestalotiopsis clavispora]|nr:hypothetical protein G7054_g7709 [Neopestalotiopsis clavispora]